MVDFAEIADLISDVIADETLGRAVTLTSITPGAYNTATGQTAAATTATQTPQAVIEDYGGRELIDGLILAGDKKVSIPAADLTTAPKPSDTITIGSDVFAVLAVSTTEAGGEAILYVCQCRRA